ncbi:MAG: translocation/assembly module TamB [Muribaculaceae bacterium]|nr:translocation/assembly module TamB [Muribaculaceae bacterium]
MTLIVLLVAIYVGLYVVLSVPSVQLRLKEMICKETSGFLGGRLEIDRLTVRPFSEVLLSGVSLDSPEGQRCAEIDKVAAGIDLWKLMTDRKIVLNYAEIIGLNATVEQDSVHGPLNIQFLIDALSPKDKNKPSAKFDLRIRNIVVRDSKAIFSRKWMRDASGANSRFSEIAIDGLRMDLSIPVLRNDLFRFDVRNIQFDVTPGVSVRGISAQVSFFKDTTLSGSDRLLVKDLKIKLPNSFLTVGDMDLAINSLTDLDAKVDGHVTPSDLSKLWSPLEAFDSPWSVNIDSSLKGKRINLGQFRLEELNSGSSLSVRGNVDDFNKRDSLDISLEELKADLSAKLISDATTLIPKLSDKGKTVLQSLGKVSLDLQGNLQGGDIMEARGNVSTQIGIVEFSASGRGLHAKRPQLKLSSDAEGLELGKLLSSDKVGRVSATLEADVTGLDRNAQGTVRMRSDECEIMGNFISDLNVELNKSGDEIDLIVRAMSDEMEVNVDGSAFLAGKDTEVDADIDISGFNPSAFGVKGKMADCSLSGSLTVHTVGNNADNIIGEINLKDLDFERRDGRKLSLTTLKASIDEVTSDDSNHEAPFARDVKIDCDWLSARLTGKILPSTLPKELKDMIASVFPTLLPSEKGLKHETQSVNDFVYDINIKGVSGPYVFFETPIRPLIDIPIKGTVDASRGIADITFSTPHLQQGKNKLLRDIRMSMNLDSSLGTARMNTGLIFPAKKGDAELVADIFAVRDKVTVNLGINPTMESVVKGGLGLEASFSRLPDSFSHDGELAVNVDILPSVITVNDMSWMIAKGGIDYSGKRISISNFLIRHEDQFVKIDGTASESTNDVLKVKLNDIDLEYIFNILNINYVTFGGMASGEVEGSKLLTKAPAAKTKSLRVKGLSYNGAILGDGDLASDYMASEQKVGIYGVIRDPLTRERRASIDGGIWVTRDSLSFGFDANRINIGFMKPFVSAFCSDIYGAASGKCKLYGTFSDIDLTGGLKADTLSMKLDFTNTWYHAGNDSVFLSKGMIDVAPLTLYDDEGHSAQFSGWLKHRYFHDPVFSFKLRDAKSLLCYNTNEKINPLWYGTIYGSGHAQINGEPGLIDIDMNMTTEEGSKFYYVISDAEDVEQSSFLTFTDRRKESLTAAKVDSVPEYLKRFHKQTQEMETSSSNVILSLKGTVTNDALVTLVMDPRAGDNITARGQGALQMDYNMASNDLRMIGTYVLDEGNYNFTLQDIIIKNFNIKKGSLIKFDGDPMKATLDIAATYRVNTNLTDLDKSFSTDKELNRTNVPVDAVLLVDGPMTNPDITFDIELPSLTSDVERKVKSIVSTNDMMSRQIIYLLALNRFYTPEYTGGQSNGSEWSSMASSTISSQLSNILSQMTDKLNVSPSFRSEKGDFSDMEFDLALSSRLLNNRLLINGNFGYRDRSTSNTQFVGDFDIEYLLSKNGNLRLKAYNHFNDQNYYLRSALTTQGVGVVFRRDFDRLFKRKRKEDQDDKAESEDSVMKAGLHDQGLEMSEDTIENR